VLYIVRFFLFSLNIGRFQGLSLHFPENPKNSYIVQSLPLYETQSLGYRENDLLKKLNHRKLFYALKTSLLLDHLLFSLILTLAV